MPKYTAGDILYDNNDISINYTILCVGKKFYFYRCTGGGFDYESASVFSNIEGAVMPNVIGSNPPSPTSLPSGTGSGISVPTAYYTQPVSTQMKPIDTCNCHQTTYHAKWCNTNPD